MINDAPETTLRSRLRSAYWLLIVTLLGLPLVAPLLRWTEVACTHDGHLHYHRIAAMRHMWDNGIYLTRWLPDLAFGYGYPFFVYREGPPLFIPFIPHLLGLPLPAASNLFYALTILAAGWFMFLWVRDLFGERAAVVSAVAYMAAPYVLIDALVRGNSPESLALPLFPLILWAGRRWVLFGRAGAFLVGVLGLALLSLSHNISAVIFAPTVAIYLLALILLISRGAGEQRSRGDDFLPPAPFLLRSPARLPALLRATLLIGLGLGLAFFYTGGALLELDQVTLEQSTTTRNNDWRYNFASPAEIFSPVAAEDPWLVNPPLQLRLGWMPSVLAALGLTGLLWIRGRDARGREQRLHIILMAIGAALYLLMALPISAPLWERIPLIDFVQFPWRFVGRAALPVALLAGIPVVGVELLVRDYRRQTTDHSGRSSVALHQPTRISASSVLPTLLTAAAVALLMVEAVPNLYPRYCPEESFPTILTVHDYEHATGLVGVDPEGSYFPRTVIQRPSGSPLEADYRAGQTPQRFDAAALPAGASMTDVTYGTQGVRLTVDSPTAFTARYLSFDFPGWSATVDGQPVAITPEDPSGLITFPVPAGRHTIEVGWGATPTRLALVGLSALCGLAAAVVFLVARRRAQPGKARLVDRTTTEIDWAILILLAVALAAGKAWNDGRLARQGPTAPPVEHAAALQGGELALRGYSLSRDSVPAGQTFDIDMAWSAVAPPSVDYQTNVWLQRRNEAPLWSDKGTERPRLYEDAAPTRLWAAGEWGWDSREVRVLPGTPPGDYDIIMTLFDKATLQPLTLTDPATGQVVGPTATLGVITVDPTADDQPPPAQYPLVADVPATALRLLGYNQDRAAAAAGDPLLLTLFWQCERPDDSGRVALSLVGESGATAHVWDIPPVVESLGPDAWPEVGYLRGQHLLRLPAGLPGGRYRFVLNDAIPLGELAISAPDRLLEQPPLSVTINTPFLLPSGEPAATLVGIADAASSPLPPCSPAPLLPCSLPLVWQAQAELPTGYHVFVHLVDGAGNILAQADGVPAGWTRPTTGWLPGEFIIDEHTLTPPATLPDGPLALRVGLYDPATGVRLPTATADYAEFPLRP